MDKTGVACGSSLELNIHPYSMCSGQTHAFIALLVESPSQTAIVMHSRSSHVPPVLGGKLTADSTVHCACIIPHNHISRVVPLHVNHVFILGCVFKDPVQNGLRLLQRDAFEGMDVFCEVDGTDSGPLVHLKQRVAAHEVVRGLYILETLGSSQFPRMEE